MSIFGNPVLLGGGGGSSPVIQALSATANGTYTAPSGVDGYSPVTVNVAGGSTLITKTITANGTYDPADDNADGYSQVTVNVAGGDSPIDLSFLPNSVAADVLSSRSLLPTGSNIISIGKGEKLYTDLSAANTDVTCYAVVKCTDSSECVLLCVPYANSDGNSPSFYTPFNVYSVDCTIYASNTNIPGLSCNTFHVYAMSLNASTKAVRYFVDGAYFMEKTFNNSGSCVVVGAGDKNGSSYANAVTDVAYFGVVADLESDATIIANMQTIMTKLGIS